MDVPNNHIYWADESTGKIERGDLDGSNRSDVVTGLSMPIGLAIQLPLENLATQATVTAKSTANPHAITNINDDNHDTRWNAGNDDINAWIDFNWTSPVTFNTVHVTEFRSRIRGHTIQYGSSLSEVPLLNFSPVDHDASSNHPGNQQKPVVVPDHKITFPTITTDRLRYQVLQTVNATSEPTFYEISIYNDPYLNNPHPLDNGLVAHYPFDGNASDISDNALHGTTTSVEWAEPLSGWDTKPFPAQNRQQKSLGKS